MCLKSYGFYTVKFIVKIEIHTANASLYNELSPSITNLCDFNKAPKCPFYHIIILTKSCCKDQEFPCKFFNISQF